MSKEAATKELGGKTKKEARKAMSENLQEQMANGEITGKSAKELMANAKNTQQITGTTLENGKIAAKTTTGVDKAFANATKKGGKTAGKAAKQASSSSTFDKIQKWGNSVMTAGSTVAQLMGNNQDTGTTAATPKSYRLKSKKMTTGKGYENMMQRDFNHSNKMNNYFVNKRNFA